LLATTNKYGQADRSFVIANRFAIKYSAKPYGFQAKRCGNPPEKKKADLGASLATTNKYAQDDKDPVLMTVLLSF